MFSQALTSMFQETTTGSNLSRKGTLLMAEVLHLANKVLPLSLAAKIQVSAQCTVSDDVESNLYFQVACPRCFQAALRLQTRRTPDHRYIRPVLHYHFHSK